MYSYTPLHLRPSRLFERRAADEPKGPLNLARSYNFVDKVSVVDELRTLVQHSGMTYQQLAEATGLSAPCIGHLFNGKTIGPRRTTLEALARCFGKRLTLVDVRLE